MKIIKNIPQKNGGTRIVMDVPHGVKVVAIRSDGYYKLGYPLEDVVHGAIIVNALPVSWCCVSQEWA